MPYSRVDRGVLTTKLGVQVLLYVGLYIGFAGFVEAQGRQGLVVARDSTSVASPVITAGFAVPTQDSGLAWATVPWLPRCQAVFEDAVVAHPDVPSAGADTMWRSMQFSPAAIAAGRHCLARMNVDTLPPYELMFLRRFAVALDDDTLFQRVVTRQLMAAKASVRDQLTIVTDAIHLLLQNPWDEVDNGLDHVVLQNDAFLVHRTAAHVALARRYAAQLDTMHPPGEVLETRMNVSAELHELDRSPWNVDSELVWFQGRLRLAQSVPLAQIPDKDDQQSIQISLHVLPLRVAESEYLKTPTHANLTHFIVLRNALWGAGNGITVDSLLGHPAPALKGDYWFNVSANALGLEKGQTSGQGSEQKSPVVPAPGTVTLVVFVDAVKARDALMRGDLGSKRNFATLATQLSQLHMQYPALQIVLVAMTGEIAQLPGEPDDPSQDAEFISDLFTRQLKLPGMVCVLQSRYHTEPGQTAIPLSSPVLNGFHLDPRSYDGNVFLIDATGWIVSTNKNVLDGHLIQRLLPR